jgi:hypothetical protein
VGAGAVNTPDRECCDHDIMINLAQSTGSFLIPSSLSQLEITQLFFINHQVQHQLSVRDHLLGIYSLEVFLLSFFIC